MQQCRRFPPPHDRVLRDPGIPSAQATGDRRPLVPDRLDYLWAAQAFGQPLRLATVAIDASDTLEHDLLQMAVSTAFGSPDLCLMVP